MLRIRAEIRVCRRSEMPKRILTTEYTDHHPHKSCPCSKYLENDEVTILTRRLYQVISLNFSPYLGVFICCVMLSTSMSSVEAVHRLGAYGNPIEQISTIH